MGVGLLAVTGQQAGPGGQGGQAVSSRNTATTAELMAVYQAEQAHAQAQAEAVAQSQLMHSALLRDGHHSRRYDYLHLFLHLYLAHPILCTPGSTRKSVD